MARRTGRCKVCGWRPVAFDARTCPECGASNPNPGAGNRYVSWTVPAGLVVGGLVGAVWGYFGFDKGWVGAFGGGLLGSLPGLIVGLTAGLVAGWIARLFGVR
jgi:hypothetical protein